MSGPDLSNYIEVADRIKEFLSKYPDGSLQCEAVEYRDLPVEGQPNTKMHIIYHALAFRTPDDPRPGHGMASEPLPGLTQFTRGSELMNAETSAWGRALAALGFVSKRDGSNGVASANEVRARRDSPGRTTEGVTPSEAQLKFLNKLIGQKKASPDQVQIILHKSGFDLEVEDGWRDKLTGGKQGSASALIDWLKDRPLPDPTNPSDVPPPAADEFSHGDPGPHDVPFSIAEAEAE